MAGSASPIDIAPPRYSSSSPRTQTSNLTSALQEAHASDFKQPQNTPTNGNTTAASDARPPMAARNNSTSNGFGSYYGTGARPITMRDMPRRESNTGGSFMGGMSWGGMSVGSWIRDDIMMGTSPAMNQSPSFHSSSYLPKMEANFMKDFLCCNLTHASLHDLLQHYEEAHADTGGQPQRGARQSISNQGALPANNRNEVKSGSAANRTSSHVDPAAYTQHGFQTLPAKPANGLSGPRTQRLGSDGFNRTSLSTVQDMDSLDDMEMDDPSMPMGTIDEASPFNAQQQFGGQGNMPRLNVNVANAMQSQGFRSSTPTTPMATSQPFNMNNNPTVSSVNTPTLGTSSINTSRTPDSSTPGTPAEFNDDFAGFNYPGISMPVGGDFNFNNMNFGGVNTGFDGTIDQPAKRLFSKAGTALTQQQMTLALRQAHASGDHAAQARLLASMQGMQEEVKPHKCPVIGCEKAYKNQNGLKYHKQHGHQNQQLKENEDGTFSIVDPVTSEPYPGNYGMEKEKPYRCEFCGKRYKNLNGLKYHRQHSANCNPDLKLGQLNINGLPPIGMSVNVAGAGLSGMDNAMY